MSNIIRRSTSSSTISITVSVTVSITSCKTKCKISTNSKSGVKLRSILKVNITSYRSRD